MIEHGEIDPSLPSSAYEGIRALEQRRTVAAGANVVRGFGGLHAVRRAVIERNADETAGCEMLPVRAIDTPVLGGRDDLFRCVAVDQEHHGDRRPFGRRPVDVELEHALAVRPVDQIALDSSARRRPQDGGRGKLARVKCHQAFSPWYLPLYPSAVALESRKNTSCATRAPRCSR